MDAARYLLRRKPPAWEVLLYGKEDHFGARKKHDALPFAMSVLFFVAAFLTLGVIFWPYMIPYSITVANAAAPHASLSFLFYGAGILVLPVVVVAYTVCVYWTFRGKVRKGDG